MVLGRFWEIFLGVKEGVKMIKKTQNFEYVLHNVIDIEFESIVLSIYITIEMIVKIVRFSKLNSIIESTFN